MPDAGPDSPDLLLDVSAMPCMPWMISENPCWRTHCTGSLCHLTQTHPMPWRLSIQRLETIGNDALMAVPGRGPRSG